MTGTHDDAYAYDGRVRTGKRWWQFWKPEYERRKWCCRWCGEIYDRSNEREEIRHGRYRCSGRLLRRVVL